jgi:tellurite resistance protein TerC
MFYVVMAAAFGVVFSAITTWDNGAQFFAGYVVEKSLSVDNLFVFVIIIGAFAVPRSNRRRRSRSGSRSRS